MSMYSRRWLFSVVLFALAGCSREEPTFSVEGKVLIDGQPLKVGTVIFTPDAARGNTSMHEPRGKIDENGVYRLSLTKGHPGATRGWYKISLSAQQLKDPKDRYSYVSLIPTRYTRPDTSGLEREVVNKPAPGAYDIELSSREP
jgi:hypothetical protein